LKGKYVVLFGALACVANAASAQSLAEQLAWAYAITPGPAPPAPADDGTRYSLDGSQGRFTLDQIRNRMGPADWYPGDHPAMPPVVAHGREAAGIWACSLCHYPNGKGRPENASVSGLPVAYFMQQLEDFRHDLRKSAESRKANSARMALIASRRDNGGNCRADESEPLHHDHALPLRTFGDRREIRRNLRSIRHAIRTAVRCHRSLRLMHG